MSDTVDENARTQSGRTDSADPPSFVQSSLADSPTLARDALTIELSPELTVGGNEMWAVEHSTSDDASLGIGDAVQFSKPMTAADVAAFARISGDTNPLHLDEEIAEQTRFGGRIVHGTLVAGTISAALARFPGAVIYLSQDLEFLAPVELGQTVTADCEIVEEFGDGRYRLRTTVTIEDDTTVIDGEAVVLISEESASDSVTE